MNKEVSHLSSAPQHSPALEIITPLSTRMLFWRARYLNNSSFLCHIPFLFWLVEACRPKSFVELGVGEGVSYFAACQAIDKLDLDARCHGIISGDVGAEIPDPVNKYNTQHYGDFSRLRTGDIREAGHLFADGSIDLLHVDIDPLEENTLDSLSHDWARKLSPQGILLLHGVTSRFSSGHARDFLNRLIASYPSVTLEEGEGLAVILYGEDRHERLMKLASLSFGMTGYSEAHHVFSRLGATHSFEWSTRVEAERATKAWEKYEISKKALQKSVEQCEVLQEKVGTLDCVYNARAEQIAILQGKLFDFQTTEEKKDAEITALRHSLDEARVQQAEAIAMRDTALAENQRALEDQDSELDQLKAQMATRFDELATLTKILKTKEDKHTASLAKANEGRLKDSAEKDNAIGELTAERDAARASLTSLRIAFEKNQVEQAEALATRDTALAENQRALEDQTSELDQLKAQMATRFDEITALTKVLETKEQDMRRLRQDLDDVRTHRDALLNSTSWKLTQPVRKAVGAMRR